MGFERTELPSGIRVLSEVVPGQRSVTAGVWVGTGSRDEPADLSGVTHLIEHLVFKGTPSRSALDIAQSFDAIGGDLNAFTTKEFTCFHARSLGEDLALGIRTMADMLRNARMDEDDVVSERNVVLEEISMHEDSPEDNVFDLFYETLWPGHALGAPVQGRERTVGAMGRDPVVDWYRRGFVNGDIVVSAAGAISHDELVDLVASSFGGANEPPRARVLDPIAPANGALAVRERDIEQVHLVYGTSGLPRGDDRRWALGVMNVALGGGMSSRLVQEIREKRGLAYSVSSGNESHVETGAFTVDAACSAEHLLTVLEVIRDEVARVAAEGITDEERARAIRHLRGSFLLSLDDPGSRMSHLGKSELLMKEILTPDEIIARIEAVTAEQVRDVAAAVLGGQPWTLALLGPVTESDVRPFAGAAA